MFFGTILEHVAACSVRGLRAKPAPASATAVIGGGPAQRLPPVRSESPHGPYGMRTNYSALRACMLMSNLLTKCYLHFKAVSMVPRKQLVLDSSKQQILFYRVHKQGR